MNGVYQIQTYQKPFVLTLVYTKHDIHCVVQTCPSLKPETCLFDFLILLLYIILYIVQETYSNSKQSQYCSPSFRSISFSNIKRVKVKYCIIYWINVLKKKVIQIAYFFFRILRLIIDRNILVLSTCITLYKHSSKIIS